MLFDVSRRHVRSGVQKRDDAAEGFDDGGKIRIEVRVIEFDVADEEVPGLVVEKLRSAVEEGGVVLVPLEHEVRPSSPSISAGKVFHLAADQEARVAAGIQEQPGEKSRGGRLAVSARDDDGDFSRKKVLAHSLRQ